MAAVGALLDAGLDPHLAAVDDAILLHHHGVGALGHRRAGEDADRLAARDRPPERMPGGGPPADRQHGVAVRQQVGMRQREAVDGAVGMRRHVDAGDQVARQDAAGRGGERHRLGVDDGGDALLDQRQCRVDAEQRAAKGKAIVAELRHQHEPEMVGDETRPPRRDRRAAAAAPARRASRRRRSRRPTGRPDRAAACRATAGAPRSSGAGGVSSPRPAAGRPGSSAPPARRGSARRRRAIRASAPSAATRRP